MPPPFFFFTIWNVKMVVATWVMMRKVGARNGGALRGITSKEKEFGSLPSVAITPTLESFLCASSCKKEMRFSLVS